MDHFEISISAESDAALAALKMFEMSAVIIYISESGEKSFSVFNAIFESVKSKHIPIIFLAEKGNNDDENNAFAMGAIDYSTRRQETTKSLINRINLRISASEYERRFLKTKNADHSLDSDPEAIFIGKTILVVDDLEINREIIAAMLSHIKGLIFEFAVNGKEAVEKYSNNPGLYSLILMDIQMPEMDGLAATKAIRSCNTCENARKIPIIAMTAGVSEDEITLCLEAGMDNFLEKPMDYEKLLAVAAEHCL